MNWLLFYLLIPIHILILFVIGVAIKSLKLRALLWIFLISPAAIYCKDYFLIQLEHKQLCAAEGGLKILREPEKANRVRLVGDSYDFRNARGLLSKFRPQLVTVEFMHPHQMQQNSSQQYISVYAESNPRAGLAMENFPWKEEKFLFNEAPVDVLAPDSYEISEHVTRLPNGQKEETRLSKNGKEYAKYTMFEHHWGGIRYPDAVPQWRCPDPNLPGAVVLRYEPLVGLILPNGR